MAFDHGLRQWDGGLIAEARKVLVEEKHLTRVQRLHRSVISVVVILLNSGLSGSLEHVSKHGKNGGSNLLNILSDEPHHLFGTGGRGHASHIFEIIKVAVGLDRVLVLENEIQHINVLGQRVFIDVSRWVGEVHQIEFAKNIGHFTGQTVVHDGQNGLLAEVTGHGSMQDLDFHFFGGLVLGVLTGGMEMDFVSLVVGLVGVDQNSEVPFSVFEA